MKIAIITENFLPKVDGVTRTLARLLEHLALKGHQVLLLGPETNSTSYAGAELVGTWGIPLFVYPELKCNFWRPKLTEKLLSFKPDVIHLVDPVFLGAFGLAMIRYHLPQTPIVSSYHTNLAVYCNHFGFGFMTSIMWSWNRYCHSFSQFVACPSVSTRSILDDHGFQHVRIWPRGVDISLFSPQRRSSTLRAQWLDHDSDKKIILYVGRVSYEKNINLVIEAYKKMDHQQCHLVLVGHGPALDEIQQYCATTHLPVTFTGYLQGKDLSEAYASADLFAFPSVTETFGQVVLESMASGLPVVGLKAEGVRDLVVHSKTGLLLDHEGLSIQEQIAKYRCLLESLVNQPNILSTMSRDAIDHAKQYTWYEAMECMMRLYHEATDIKEETKDRCLVSLQFPGSIQHAIDDDDSGVEEDFSPTEEYKTKSCPIKAPIIF
ncbi:glycosyl transferase group 1 [Blakeslea trispora]|nr:glycosyl transferase group 1 [Blakeslea trispora]